MICYIFLAVNKFHPDPNIAHYFYLQTFNFFSWFLCCTLGLVDNSEVMRFINLSYQHLGYVWEQSSKFIKCILVFYLPGPWISKFCWLGRSLILTRTDSRFSEHEWSLTLSLIPFILLTSKIFRNYWTLPPTPKLLRRRRRQPRKLWARRQQLQCLWKARNLAN